MAKAAARATAARSVTTAETVSAARTQWGRPPPLRRNMRVAQKAREQKMKDTGRFLREAKKKQEKE